MSSRSGEKAGVFRLDDLALENDAFFRLVETYPHGGLQIVLMAIPTGKDIGWEVHPHLDQASTVVQGTGKASVDGNEFLLFAGDTITIPSGSRHNIYSINTGDNEALKLFSFYTRPAHNGVTKEKKPRY